MEINQWDLLLCINCKVESSTLIKKREFFYCTNCNHQFPCFDDSFPILLENLNSYLSNSYSTISKDVIHLENLLESFKNKRKENFSNEVLEKAKLGIGYNIDCLKEIKNNVAAFLSLDDMVAERRGEQLSYSSNFNYLKKDWSWQDEHEKNVHRIKEILLKGNEFLLDNDSCLFLGAGLGRYAYEMSNHFEKVYALDYSPTMALFLGQLHKKDLSFCNINYKNVEFIKDLFPIEMAKFKKFNKDSVKYFIGDVRNLAILSKSISCIYSVYFTDVLKISSYIDEISRVLKPGGIFFHFGPLEYHFSDISEMLTYEELRSTIIDNNFEVLFEDSIEMPFERRFHKESHKVYKNWILVLKKVGSREILNENSILKIASRILFQENKVITEEGELIEDVVLFLGTRQRYVGADLVIEILRKVDGNRSLNEIFENVKKNKEVKLEFNEMVELIQLLISKQMLTLAKNHHQRTMNKP